MSGNSWDIELTHYSGVVIPLVLDSISERVGTGENARSITHPRSIRSALSAAQAVSPLSQVLESWIQETWIGGCGGGGATMGYTQAPGMNTMVGDSKQGYAFPGPAASDTNFALLTANASTTPIVAIEEFLGNLYYAQQGTAVANTPRVLLAPSGGSSVSDSLTVGAANALTDLLVFTNQSSGTRTLWASGVDGAGARLHYTTNGTVWTSTVSGIFGATRFDWLAKVYWKTANGDQAWRMVAGDKNTRKVSYTRPGADPALAASWVLDAFQVDTSGVIWKPPTIRRRLIMPGQDNIFDVDELGNTPGIVSDMDHHRHPFNGYASYYQDDYVIYTYQNTVARVYVGEAGLLQTTPGVCGPGAFTQAEHEFNGWATCFTGDQGWIVVSTYNPNNGKCGIWWGRDRKYYPEVETANPMIWHGPMIFAEDGRFVTSMRTHTILSSGQLHLWVASVPYSASAIDHVGGSPSVHYFALPTAGQPLSDFLTGGDAVFAVGSSPGPWNPRSEIVSLPYSWGDKGSPKFSNDVTIGNRGVNQAGDGTHFDFYLRSDPAPGDTSFGAATTFGDHAATQTEVPAIVTSGHKTQWLIKVFSPHGADALATRALGVLDSVRITSFLRAPTVRVLDVTVQYGLGVRALSAGKDTAKSVADIRELIQDLTEGDRTTMRIRPDRRYTVICRQVMDETDEFIGDAERTTLRLQLSVLTRLS